MCFSKSNLEWYPFLPAVFTFQYPVFRGMSANPHVTRHSSGWKLTDEDIALWHAVETVMINTAAVLQEGSLHPLEQVAPLPPREYGYARAHTQEKFARKSITKSLNAFQRLLGYCSYSLANSTNVHRVKQDLYSERWSMAGVYRSLGFAVESIHILVKNLFFTMEEMKRNGNFAGIVVDYTVGYDCSMLGTMLTGGVPVYLSWPGAGPNPYLDQRKFPRNHIIKSLFPKNEVLQELEDIPKPMKTLPCNFTDTTALATSIPTVPDTTIPTIVDASPHSTGYRSNSRMGKLYNHPLDYVHLRLPLVRSELESSADRQRMKDRAKSAKSFSSLGTAKYYVFDSHDVVDQHIGKEGVLWSRTLLTRHDALGHFEDANPRHLW